MKLSNLFVALTLIATVGCSSQQQNTIHTIPVEVTPVAAPPVIEVETEPTEVVTTEIVKDANYYGYELYYANKELTFNVGTIDEPALRAKGQKLSAFASTLSKACISGQASTEPCKELYIAVVEANQKVIDHNNNHTETKLNGYGMY